MPSSLTIRRNCSRLPDRTRVTVEPRNRTPAETYDAVQGRIASLTDGETDPVALMATVACELFHAFERFHWVGFYRNVGNATLKIGPYQGGHGCLVIPFDRGICGRCASTLEVQVVDDVNADPAHIACSSSTQSELVLPVFDHAGQLLAVLDIDSDHPKAFTPEDGDRLTSMLEPVFSQVRRPEFA